MERMDKRNLAMLFDFYEMTMANGYFRKGMKDDITYFDIFFRRVPDGGGFAIAAGLEQLIEYIAFVCYMYCFSGDVILRF